MRTRYLIFLVLFPLILSAQILTWEPVYLTEDDSVTVVYDATQGSGGLAGFTGDVYMHTGVITSASSGPADWKHVKTGWGENTPATKLERIGTDLYRFVIQPNIRTYYGIYPGEEVLQMAFVFRSADSDLEGKTETGGDIFIPLRIGINIVTPAQQLLFVDLNEPVAIFVIGSADTDTLKLYENNELRYQTANDSLTYDLMAAVHGKTWVKIEAVNETGVFAADSFAFVVNFPVETEARPAGVIDGIHYVDDQTVVLSLYAPNKDFVYLIGDFNNWEIEPEYLMKRTPDLMVYWLELNSLAPFTEYAFQYLVDGKLRIADPYADKILDPWNDKYIDPFTYPALKAYPAGKTDRIVSVFQTAQDDFEWDVTDFQRPAKTDLVIYELLIRDFLAAHNYQTLIDTLDYLDNLGVNAIELMPFNEFEGNEGWGYNPSFYFAPDKYYGTKENLKRFIDACHARGIAVIMDMVLNHSYGQSPLVRLYWDAANNRPAAENPWYNPTAPSGAYAWGYDFNHESAVTKKFIDRVNQYWLTEYKVDGFRFDFTKGFTNKPGSGDAYDISRINNLKRMADQIWAVENSAYIILEHWCQNTEEKELSDYGMMLWGNVTYKYREAAMGYNSSGKSDFSWGSYQKRDWNDPHLVTYLESHDEERVMFKNLKYGNSNNSYSIKELETALQRAKLVATFFFTIPGPKMIWQFGELGYDFSIDYNGRVGNKPIRWNYFQETARKNVYKTYRALINLKKNYDVFRTRDFSLSVAGTAKRISLKHESMNVIVVGNFDIVERPAYPNFPNCGKWYDFFSGDSFYVTDTQTPRYLPPGDFQIYSTVKFPDPEYGIATSVEESSNPVVNAYNLSQNYPNPFNLATTIQYEIPQPGLVKIDIFNARGQLVRQLQHQEKSEGQYRVVWDGLNAQELPAPSGVYFFRFQAGGWQKTMKAVLIK